MKRARSVAAPASTHTKRDATARQTKTKSWWFSGIRASARPPDERGADDVVPYRAHQRAPEAGQPPVLLVVVQPGGGAHIGDRADRADQLEPQQAGQEPPA